ncbi:RNA polymerase sigma-70 factor [Arcticibacter svalbardensis MN12-7]|uniref:RNA polymerase sigma factor n=1 Tax=Arcticibacter svalbardensis MN12-7 TaxID=1150600 RepID=R9H2F7_9SPHI|nr:sigma-70 family RNA polymerase sigma factor [Arcticibacter svalbardensis]EOR95404.1 RNA polymerase sigma-70 factor [Arcticibacter svalbardensis MN12-7]
MRRDHIKIAEHELIEGIRRKDRMAAEALYDMYSAAIFGVIIRVVQNQELAEDLLQDTFVKAWNSFNSYDASKGKLFTWISNIARNSAIDKLRSKDFRNHSNIDKIENNVYAIDEQQYVEINSDGMGVRELVEKLKPQDKVILDLIYFKGYTHVEVSDELHLPLGTVKTRLRSAINTLKSFFN